MTDDVTVTVAGVALSGWTDVRITRRIDGCPNDFDVGLTERYPGEAAAFLVHPGETCTVAIGADVCITGYIDRFVRSYDRNAHNLTITGRGKTQDLVDCSAVWPGGQIVGTNAQDVASKLAGVYGITVTTLGDNLGPSIPQLNLVHGETSWDIIERTCRYAGLLAYEATDGNLVLANSQDIPASSGFTEGVNVQRARVTSSMDQRFSQVDTYLMSMDTLDDTGQGGNLKATATDPNVPRFRKLDVIAEAGGGGLDVAIKRGLWEVARRFGRSFVVQVTCDTWRDSAGVLWTPNTVAPVALPALKFVESTLLIGQVEYRRNGAEGTTTTVTLMPPEAFQPQPILLQPTRPDAPASTPKVGG